IGRGHTRKQPVCRLVRPDCFHAPPHRCFRRKTLHARNNCKGWDVPEQCCSVLFRTKKPFAKSLQCTENSAMRYFIHLSTGSDLIGDPEGAQCVDLAAAIAEASQSARDLVAEELRCGKSIPSRWEARIATADGDILKVLPFSRLIAADSRVSQQPAGP